MVYPVCSKIQIKGDLVVVRAIHVGGFGTSTNLDMPLAVNGQGQIYIPGTSLAGALRGWMVRTCKDDLVRSLWGYQPKDSDKNKGHASRVMIEDAVAYRSAEAKREKQAMTPRDIEIRSGVGINRHSGTAADNFLYNRGVIPRGSVLQFELSVDILKESETAIIKQAIEQLLLGLDQEDIRIGAGKSRGLGRIRLKNCKQPKQENQCDEGIAPFMVSTRQGMLQYLQHRDQQKHVPWTEPASQEKTLPVLQIDIQWHPVEPLMVKSEMTGVAADILPLMGSVSDTECAFLLPGASIKGALRTQAERIIRTLLPALTQPDQSFEEQIQLPLINELFGIAADESTSEIAPDTTETTTYQPGLGALSIEDCFSDTRHPADTLQQLSRIPRDNADELNRVLAETRLTNKTFGQNVFGNAKRKIDTQLAYHVAIDRWTGGAADGFLYANFEPFNIPWEPIELSIDFDRLADSNTQLAGVTLLLLLLRDMANKRIPLGYGTHRGLGTLTLTQAELTFSSHESIPDPLRGKHMTLTDLITLSDLDNAVCHELNQAWSDWLENTEKSQATEQSKEATKDE